MTIDLPNGWYHVTTKPHVFVFILNKTIQASVNNGMPPGETFCGTTYVYPNLPSEKDTIDQIAAYIRTQSRSYATEFKGVVLNMFAPYMPEVSSDQEKLVPFSPELVGQPRWVLHREPPQPTSPSARGSATRFSIEEP